jgi:hypothetical protein
LPAGLTGKGYVPTTLTFSRWHRGWPSAPYVFPIVKVTTV